MLLRFKGMRRIVKREGEGRIGKREAETETAERGRKTANTQREKDKEMRQRIRDCIGIERKTVVKTKFSTAIETSANRTAPCAH